MRFRPLPIFVSLLTIRRLTIFQRATAMNRTRVTHSSSDTSSTRLTIRLEDLYSYTLVERRAEKVDFRIYRQGVGAHHLPQQLSNGLIFLVIQILMQKFNGLGVILENRYYGQSYPYNTSTTDELRFLTTEQSKRCLYHRSLGNLTWSSHRRQRLLQATCYLPWGQHQPERTRCSMDHVRRFSCRCTHCLHYEDLQLHLRWRHW